MSKEWITRLLFVAYIGCVVGANWAGEHFGIVSIGFGFHGPAGLYFVGLSFALRDFLQDAGGRSRVTVAILIGAALSYAIAPAFALASATAFLASEGLDFAVYTPLRRRDQGVALFLSNLAGAVADSVLFLCVVGDARATLDRSGPILPQLRAAGFRAALVAQDGLEALPIPWDSFDCLFVGGSTAWKLSEAAYRLAREADERGKWTHMGRVNSWRRLKAAAISGYDSADGTALVFDITGRMAELQNWIGTLRQTARIEI